MERDRGGGEGVDGIVYLYLGDRVANGCLLGRVADTNSFLSNLLRGRVHGRLRYVSLARFGVVALR